MHPLGQTHTVVNRNHAFIAPDGHVAAPLPGWRNATAITLISPRLMNSPQFSQHLVQMSANSAAAPHAANMQRFLYLLDGTAQLRETMLSQGDFAYLPAHLPHSLSSTEGCRLLLFEKPYLPSQLSDKLPQPISGSAWAGHGEPFMDDEAARLRVLLPTDLPYDMAINLFTFQPGTALPFVETHVMEHGLYLLEGQGIYRLDDCWYPIQAGDTIWMGPYCPQWFCAIGKTQSTYIYYKDVNR